MADTFGSSRKIALRNPEELEVFWKDLKEADYPDVEFELDGLEAEEGAIRIATFLRVNNYPSEVCLKWLTPAEKRRRKSFIQFSEEEEENVFDAEKTTPKRQRQKVRAQ